MMFSSCITEPEEVDYEDVEKQILAEWIELYVPEAIRWYVESEHNDDDYSSEYYTIVTNTGDSNEKPIHEYADCWVKYNLTGYNLDGYVLVTRNELLAYQQGVFDELVRYVPLYQDLFYDEEKYSDTYSYDYLPECIKVAFNNEELNLRKGSKLTMYIPSELIDGAATGSTGYAGQYSLSYYQPLKAEIEIVEVVSDPMSEEISDIETFTSMNGGLLINYREADSDEDIDDDDWEEYNILQELIPENWSNSVDTVANLYLYRRYDPSISLNYIEPYTSQVPDCIYTKYNMKQIDSLIYLAIVEEEIEESEMDGDFVEYGDNANIWYIGRFLDGFIFDTNINEVMELITGEESYLSVLEYMGVTSSENSSFISAWYHGISQLRYGQWATLITSSTHGYGEVTLSDDIPANTPLIFHIYVEE